MCKNVWLIGAGLMAEEYVKVLRDLNISFNVIGRGQETAANFKKKMGIDVFVGGLDSFLLQKYQPASHAIIASGVEQLGTLTNLLLNYGIKNILIEKPGGLTLQEIVMNEQLAQEKNAKVYIAYNRRFYSSVKRVEKIVLEDGGITSLHFEFTEWSHIIEKASKLPEVKSEWLIANSSHVIDTAFYLGGAPLKWSAYCRGELAWHKPSIFTGAGITDRHILFSYCANWEAPGRWGIEIMTPKHRLYLKPMETVQIQNIGSVIVEALELDDQLDRKYKPGLFLQTQCFIEGNSDKDLCTISEQKTQWELYLKMKGFSI